jgi:DNA-binding SARP family transcriptional activator
VDAARFPGRQGRLLFAYLVVAQGRPVPRDELAEALWGQTLPATSDKALTVLVSKLRALLADAGLDGASALTAAFGCYRLGLPEGSWVDIVAAADAAREAERTLLAGDPARATAAASLAESVTRRPFLPGDSGAWVEQTRRELADLRGRVLGTLAEACLRSGEAAEASRWAEQAIALEPFRETGYRHLMQAHAVAGNRAEGLRVYERCRRLLAEELGAYPSPETESIYRRLLEGPPAPAELHHAILTQDPVPDGRPLAVTRAEPPPAAGTVRPRHRRRWLIAAGAATVLAVGGLVAVLVAGDSRPGLAALPGNSVGMLGTDGVLRAAVPVGQSPEGVAATAKDVWVANAGDRTVSQISAKTRAVCRPCR